MNKFRFRLINSLLAPWFRVAYPKRKIEYPDIIGYLNKKYGSPVFVENFNDLDNWHALDKNEWGSARADNICTYVKENVALREKEGKRRLVITSTPEEATGKDWDGNDVTKPISSGYVSSKFLVRPGQVVSATVDTSASYAGSWFSFWLLKKEEEGDERYRELDIFEKFMEKIPQKKYTMTVHGGTNDRREMMNFQHPLNYVNEKRLNFTCEFHPHGARIFINGLIIFMAGEPDFEGEYYVIFDDAPTIYGGKVPRNEILKALPRSLEILDFRVY